MEAEGAVCEALIPLSRCLYECLQRQLQLSSEARFGTSTKRKPTSGRDDPQEDLSGAVGWSPCSSCGLWVPLPVQRVRDSGVQRSGASVHPWDQYRIPSTTSLLCGSCKDRLSQNAATTTRITSHDAANWKFFVRCTHPKCGKFRKVPRLFPGTSGWVCGMLPWESDEQYGAGACDVPSVKLGFSSLKGKWGKVEVGATAQKVQVKEAASRESVKKATGEPDKKPSAGRASVVKASRKPAIDRNNDDDSNDDNSDDDDEEEEEEEEEDDEDDEEEEDEEEDADEEEEEEEEESPAEESEESKERAPSAAAKPRPATAPRTVQPRGKPVKDSGGLLSTSGKEPHRPAPSGRKVGSSAPPLVKDSSKGPSLEPGQQPTLGNPARTRSAGKGSHGGESLERPKRKSGKRLREDSPDDRCESEGEQVQPWALCDRCQTWRMTKERVNEDCPYWECSMEPGLRCEPFVRFNQALFTELESLLEKDA